MVVGQKIRPFGFAALSPGGVLVAGSGRYQQLVEVSTINFDLMGLDDQARILSLFERFLNALTGDLQVVVVTRPNPADPSLSARRFLVVVSCLLPKPNLPAAKAQLTAQTEAIIAGLAQIGLAARVLSGQDAREVLNLWFDQSQSLRVVEKPKEMVIGGRWCRTLTISGWPATASPGWLAGLLNWHGSLDISYHLRPVDLVLAQMKLNRKITELDSRQRQLTRRGRPEDPQSADAFDSAVELRQAIQRGSQKLFLVGLFITVWAESKKQLEQKTSQIETLLASRLFTTHNLLWQQALGLGSTLPGGQNKVGLWRNLNSACAALLFPFVGGELADPGGVFLGVNPANSSPVVVDRFCLANANSIIFAQSGAGKSYLAKVEILRSLPAGVDCIVIDPENEYQALAENLGGEVVRFEAGQKIRLNLFDKQLWAAEGKPPKVSEIVDLLDLLLGFESPKERLLADWLVGQLYERFETPVWADLISLAQDQAPDLAFKCQRFSASSLGQVLSSPTNLSLSKPLTVLALDDWPAKDRPALTLLFSAFVRSLAANNPKKRLLVIDEGWLLLENPVSAQLLAGLVRRARKSYLGVCFISQQADDFLNNPAGKVIASQSALKFLLRSDATAIKTLARQFRLSAVEQDFLLTASRGQALILAGTRHATVQVVASESEHPLITTDPSELRAGAASDNQAGGGSLAS